jgi:hypothetical protein
VDEAVIVSQTSVNTTLPNDAITEIKQLFTNFYLSPNQVDYDAINNYEANRRLSDEREIQRINQMNLPGLAGSSRMNIMIADISLASIGISRMLLRIRNNLDFPRR